MTNFNVVEWHIANDLRLKEGVTFFTYLEFNNAQIYKDGDMFIIMPMNPFAKAILTTDSLLLESWIENRFFPTDEDVNRFYLQHKDKIDHLNRLAPALKEELLEAAGIESQAITGEVIDQIYLFVKKKKNFEKYRLNFIVVLGLFLKLKKSTGVRWGILRNKQLLNPLIQIVLVKKDGDIDHYFNLEDRIVGKRGRSDRESLEYYYYKSDWRRSNEIESAEPVD